MVWLWRKFWWLWFCRAPSYSFSLLRKKALDKEIPWFGRPVLTCHPSKWSFQWVCIWRQVLQRFCSFDLDTLSYPESLVHIPPFIQILPPPPRWLHVSLPRLLTPSFSKGQLLLLPDISDSHPVHLSLASVTCHPSPASTESDDLSNSKPHRVHPTQSVAATRYLSGSPPTHASVLRCGHSYCFSLSLW